MRFREETKTKIEKLMAWMEYLQTKLEYLQGDKDIQPVVKVKVDGGFIPTRAHAADAGLDIKSPITVTVMGNMSATIDTGVHVAIPKGYVGFLKSKSGLNVNYGITSEGVIDSGFTGSITVKLYNNSTESYVVHRGDKISQLVILPILTPQIRLVDELEETERGDNGFGSTGR